MGHIKNVFENWKNVHKTTQEKIKKIITEASSEKVTSIMANFTTKSKPQVSKEDILQDCKKAVNSVFEKIKIMEDALPFCIEEDFSDLESSDDDSERPAIDNILEAIPDVEENKNFSEAKIEILGEIQGRAGPVPSAPCNELGGPVLPGAPIPLPIAQLACIRLPCLNWTTIETKKLSNTIFEKMDYKSIWTTINLKEFEDLFKLITNKQVMNKINLTGFEDKNAIYLINSSRARNISIMLKHFKMPMEQISDAIRNYDLNIISVDKLRALKYLMPVKYEIENFNKFINQGGDVSKLSKPDRFLFTFGLESRIKERIEIMTFVGDFMMELVDHKKQLNQIIKASDTIYNSEKLYKIVEITLALGNYMNKKRGVVGGFKPQALLDLAKTKSKKDKKMKVIHFIIKQINKNYPNCNKFYEDLECINLAKN